MYATLAILCKTLFLALPPALLTGRYFLPKRFTWPATVISAAILGWALLVTYEFVGEYDNERYERAYCERLKLENPDGVTLDYPCRIVHYAYTFNYELGWLKALIWFSPWLCVYALVQFLLRRRAQVGGSPPNKSLERTRD
jgi:hypothetical protein